MKRDLRKIAMRRFNGDSRRGPRFDYLMDELKMRGWPVSIDRYGNIWMEQGRGSRTFLLSSHIDVDPRIRKLAFRCYRSGRAYMAEGVLDNAVGTYINLLLTRRPPKNARVIHVFTASEEIERNNPRRFCRSAREVVKELRKRGIKPDLCVVLDTTFPGIRHPAGKLDWRKDYSELFDVSDRTHCYLDGYIRRKTARLAERLIRRFHDPRVMTRELSRYDEAFVYSRIAPSFAFGPVVYGHFDRPDQRMPLSHLRTAIRFMRRLLNARRL